MVNSKNVVLSGKRKIHYRDVLPIDEMYGKSKAKKKAPGALKDHPEPRYTPISSRHNMNGSGKIHSKQGVTMENENGLNPPNLNCQYTNSTAGHGSPQHQNNQSNKSSDPGEILRDDDLLRQMLQPRPKHRGSSISS